MAKFFFLSISKDWAISPISFKTGVHKGRSINYDEVENNCNLLIYYGCCCCLCCFCCYYYHFYCRWNNFFHVRISFIFVIYYYYYYCSEESRYALCFFFCFLSRCFSLIQISLNLYLNLLSYIFVLKMLIRRKHLKKQLVNMKLFSKLFKLFIVLKSSKAEISKDTFAMMKF